MQTFVVAHSTSSLCRAGAVYVTVPMVKTIFWNYWSTIARTHGQLNRNTQPQANLQGRPPSTAKEEKPLVPEMGVKGASDLNGAVLVFCSFRTLRFKASSLCSRQPGGCLKNGGFCNITISG